MGGAAAGSRTLITDGGMETVLVFHRGIDLPCFASFPLLDTDEGTQELRAYFEPFFGIAHEHGIGLALDTPTWRANPNWGEQLGYDAEQLAAVNQKGVRLLQGLRDENPDVPLTISGCIGPSDDGYNPSELMTADEAERYHSAQVETLAAAGADTISALTMTYPAEAIGIVRAAQKTGLPSVVSFTVETNGRLPDGTALGAAIEQVDAETGRAPAYFMVNCAHPTHFADVLEGPAGGAAASARTRRG